MNHVNEYWWKLPSNIHQADLVCGHFSHFPSFGQEITGFLENCIGTGPLSKLGEVYTIFSYEYIMLQNDV